jgi:hypothetical protein
MRHDPRVLLLFIVACGCGSNAKTGSDGGGGSSAVGGGGSGASTAGGAGGNGGGGGVPAICANFACLQTVQDLMVACTGRGACTSQNDLASTPKTIARCYDNGVHILTTTVITTDSTSYMSTGAIQVKKGADLCYTRNFMDVTPMQPDASPIISSDMTTLDASGTLVATVHVDANAVTTVTCPGGAPTVLPASCGVSPIVISGSYFVDASAPACTSGTCSF